MTRRRRIFTAEQKADAVRRHLRDKVAFSDLAEELEVQPSQIHQWVAAVLGQAGQTPRGQGRRTSAATHQKA